MGRSGSVLGRSASVLGPPGAGILARSAVPDVPCPAPPGTGAHGGGPVTLPPAGPKPAAPTKRVQAAAASPPVLRNPWALLVLAGGPSAGERIFDRAAKKRALSHVAGGMRLTFDDDDDNVQEGGLDSPVLTGEAANDDGGVAAGLPSCFDPARWDSAASPTDDHEAERARLASALRHAASAAGVTSFRRRFAPLPPPPGDNGHPMDNDTGALTATAATAADKSKPVPNMVRSAILGKGSFGVVHRVEDRFAAGHVYAVKVPRRACEAPSDLARQLAEPRAMRRSGWHPCLVNLLAFWAEDARVICQFELCGETLETDLRRRRVAASEAMVGARAADDVPASAGDSAQLARLPPGECLEVYACIGAALRHLHAMGVAHLDVKPENIYRSRPTTVGNGAVVVPPGFPAPPPSLASPWKLGDLGNASAATASPGARAAGFAPPDDGDARYLSPELLAGDVGWGAAAGSSAMADSEAAALNLPRGPYLADLWALGASLLEACRGTPLPTCGPAYRALRSQAGADAAVAEALEAISGGTESGDNDLVETQRLLGAVMRDLLATDPARRRWTRVPARLCGDRIAEGDAAAVTAGSAAAPWGADPWLAGAFKGKGVAVTAALATTLPAATGRHGSPRVITLGSPVSTSGMECDASGAPHAAEAVPSSAAVTPGPKGGATAAGGVAKVLRRRSAATPGPTRYGAPAATLPPPTQLSLSPPDDDADEPIEDDTPAPGARGVHPPQTTARLSTGGRRQRTNASAAPAVAETPDAAGAAANGGCGDETVGPIDLGAVLAAAATASPRDDDNARKWGASSPDEAAAAEGTSNASPGDDDAARVRLARAARALPAGAAAAFAAAAEAAAVAAAGAATGALSDPDNALGAALSAALESLVVARSAADGARGPSLATPPPGAGFGFDTAKAGVGGFGSAVHRTPSTAGLSLIRGTGGGGSGIPSGGIKGAAARRGTRSRAASAAATTTAVAAGTGATAAPEGPWGAAVLQAGLIDTLGRAGTGGRE